MSGIKDVVRYVNKLQFQEPPDYSFLTQKFVVGSERAGHKVTSLTAGGWVGKLKNKIKTTRFADSDSESDQVSGSAESE